MLQQENPDDHVIAIGETHSVKKFLNEGFGYTGLDWHDYVEIDPNYLGLLKSNFYKALIQRQKRN